MLDLLDNCTNLNLDQSQKFASILGINPSNGARSPKLWNAVYESLNESVVMHPMDVSESKLEAVINSLRKDSRYIATSPLLE